MLALQAQVLALLLGALDAAQISWKLAGTDVAWPQPAEMLKLAKRRIEGLHAWNPRLRDIEYEIGLP